MGAFKRFRRRVGAQVQRVWLRGRRYHCPICEGRFRRLLPSGAKRRRNSKCPGCGSKERHRTMWVVFVRLWERGVLRDSGRLLNVAPDGLMARKMERMFDYVSIDLGARRAMMRMDVTALAFPEATFDAIMCSHVLEHVPKDRKAIAELYRVLKPGGWACVQVPVKGDVTSEDLSITDPDERTRRYGQKDHVRLYGRMNFIGRLSGAGFEPMFVRTSDFVDAVEIRRIAASQKSEIFLVRKPA